jgi:uncharacterized protein
MAGPLEALRVRVDAGGRIRDPIGTIGYGPLSPVRDEATGAPLLQLPAGFRYVSFGWTGDPMDDGTPTPRAHDGMAAFAGPEGRIRLVRNHEISDETGALPGPAFDQAAGGGTTTLEFDVSRGRLLRSWTSLSGTLRNCAGGTTPWGTWLTCEETLKSPSSDARLRERHGFVFEVPADGVASPTPLTAMGRFVHEAVAVDPETGRVYLTEDNGNSGFYRFTPRVRGRLSAGGTLEMLGVRGRPQLDTRRNQPAGVEYEVTWIPIPDPGRPHHKDDSRDGLGVFYQGFLEGATAFSRLEGAWYGRGAIFFDATTGGNAGHGQIWEYTPSRERLRLVFESPGAEVLNHPDNLCVSPRGGLAICEDGSGIQCMHGLSPDGGLFPFIVNNMDLRRGPLRGFSSNYRERELAGACYSPDGQWMFVNIQSPGVTFAITGPWGSGLL